MITDKKFQQSTQYELTSLAIHIPYSRPMILSDPYKKYDKNSLEQIIMTQDNSLNGTQFSMIFHGGLAAGYYEESCYFLPFAMKYLARECKDREDVLHDILYWVRVFWDCLIFDGIWADILRNLYSLFANFTINFQIRTGNVLPIECNYLSLFFRELNSPLCFPQNYPQNATKPLHINIPYKPFDTFLIKRFHYPQKYVDYAWLILLIEGKMKGPGVFGAQTSDYLQKWIDTKDWHDAAIKSIILKTEKEPELMEFWSYHLNNAMIW